MIRHAVAEGWLLLRQRGGVSLILALALAVALALAGAGLAVWGWLGPQVAAEGRRASVAVLLHPHMDPAQRDAWLADQARAHPEWRLRVVQPEELARRLTHWFPYLTDLLEESGGGLLPLLVEIRTAEPETVGVLQGSPAVIAVGPRVSVRQVVADLAERIALLVGVVTGVVLAAAMLLAMVWVHLELFRHADEITIMRLMGATEWAVRGPFLVAVAVPAMLAAGLAVAGSVLLVGLASRLTTSLGLPAVRVPVWVMLVQVGLGWMLPVAAALLTVTRHGRGEME